MKEADLYPPLKQFLEQQAYEVKAEVQHCDLLAIRADEIPLIVELKLSLNLTVLLQAVDRLSLTPKVYIGIPRRSKTLGKRRKRMIKLLRMLGLGLLVIDPQRQPDAVQVVLDPGQYKPRPSRFRQQRLLGEFAKRVGDPNLGGQEARKGMVTAYRQKALAIAQFLQQHGACKASRLASSLNQPKARNVLYKNVYGWFERVSHGTYQLSPRGERELRARQKNSAAAELKPVTLD